MPQREFDDAVATFKTAQVRLNGHEHATQAELDRLALLSMFEYGQERKTVAERFQLPVSMLDQEIAERRRVLAPAGLTGAGRALNLPAIELATDPVHGGKVLDLVINMLSRYVGLPPHAALAIALWIFRAHADDCFHINPRLTLLSPERRCGKTTLLSLIAKLVPRALPTSNVTSSVIFRTIEAAHPTLLIDEVDSFTDAHEELRGILNSGHRRDTAQVIRNVGEDHEPRCFSTWCPMVFCTPAGGLLEQDALRTTFYGLLKAAGIRRVRFHDLRHTYASLLLQQGESSVYVKEQLGHKSIMVTVDLYGHLIPGGNRQAVDRLDGMLQKEREKFWTRQNVKNSVCPLSCRVRRVVFSPHPPHWMLSWDNKTSSVSYGYL